MNEPHRVLLKRSPYIGDLSINTQPNSSEQATNALHPLRIPRPRPLVQAHCDLHRVAELFFQEDLEPAEQPRFDLPGALAADAVAFANLLQGQRLIRHQALVKQRLLTAAEGGLELPEFLAQKGAELVALGGDVGAAGVRR